MLTSSISNIRQDRAINKCKARMLTIARRQDMHTGGVVYGVCGGHTIDGVKG
jgi:hypothetical protein